MISILSEGLTPLRLTITRAEIPRLDELLAATLDTEPDGTEIEVVSLDGWPEIPEVETISLGGWPEGL